MVIYGWESAVIAISESALNKVGCFLPRVSSSKFRVEQHWDGDHPEDTLQFTYFLKYISSTFADYDRLVAVIKMVIAEMLWGWNLRIFLIKETILKIQIVNIIMISVFQ